MPNTIVGLLIFVAFLTPGLLFLFTLERRLPSRQLSAFRETVSIAAVGVGCDAIVLLTFTVFRMVFPALTPDVGAVLRDPFPYWQSHYAMVLWWASGLLLAACVIGVVLGFIWNANMFSETSGWWDVFKTAYGEIQGVESLLVYCELTDGTLVAGALRSWNTDARDIPDRDLVLQSPLYRRLSDGKSNDGLAEAFLLPQVGIMTISARHIVTVAASYLPYDIADTGKHDPESAILVPAAPSATNASECADLPSVNLAATEKGSILTRMFGKVRSK